MKAIPFLTLRYVTFLHLFSGVLGKTQADPLAELQWASADQSPTQRREGSFFHPFQSAYACNKSVFHLAYILSPGCLCVFQYDSDGSDSQESNEEAELRRKKIEALKVSLERAHSNKLLQYALTF